MIFQFRSAFSCIKLTFFCILFSFFTGFLGADIRPPVTDYCELLGRDIQGEHYGFLGGNKLYYVAGSFGAYWHEFYESETLGFTHALFRDGRARGNGFVSGGAGGSGHDQWGWEFWRNTRTAYGSLIIDGERIEHPTPKTLTWRPDKLIAEYDINGVRIREEKFISCDDVLCDVILSDQDIEIVFEGESFWDPNELPTFDGEPSGIRFSQSCESEVNFDQATNCIQLLEKGSVMVKPVWGQPAKEGRMMYEGLNFYFSSNVALEDAKWERLKQGNIGYSFRLKIPAGKPVVLAMAVSDDPKDAGMRVAYEAANGNQSNREKTDWINDLLNEQIPYFRCSDDKAVETYYYLWSLYFLYFRDIGEDWLKYPHTQTAVNNFMGLHLWDSWAYIQAGSWVADKWKWGFGNALSWQYMVPFKDKANCMPDNFGKDWYSPLVRMVFVGATEPAWQQYRRSGSKKYLDEVYQKVFKPLYYDNGGPTPSFGTEINAIDALSNMATELGEAEDFSHWQSFRPKYTDIFKRDWSAKWEGFYGNPSPPWKDIWALSALQCAEMPKEWGQTMVEEYVLDTDKGFASPVGVNTRAADSPPNGIFRCSTISSWLAIDGMFRQDQDYAGILTTLNHTKALHREYGYPVAPEAWEENHLAWGSRYYNWDVAHVLPMIEWLAGLDYSIPEGEFRFAPHLPSTWDFIDTYTPVVFDGKKYWVHSTVRRMQKGDKVYINAEVKGNPLGQTVISGYTEDRAVLKSKGTGKKSLSVNAVEYRTDESKAKVELSLGTKQKAYKTLVWATPRSRIFHDHIEIDVQNILPGTVLRFTTDDSEPTEKSPLWDKPLRITETTNITLRAFAKDGANYLPYVMTYTSTDLKPAKTINEDPETGLNYHFYELDRPYIELPKFDELKPVRSGSIETKDLLQEFNLQSISGERKELFALHFFGTIEVPVDEVYHFKLSADDGARLLVDGEQVIELNTFSYVDPWEGEGSIGLQSGKHRVDLFYYQQKNRNKLVLRSRKGDETEYKDILPERWNLLN